MKTPSEKRPSEVERLVKYFRDSDAGGILLKGGLSETFFLELIVGCLLNYKEARETLNRLISDFKPDPTLDKKSTRSALHRVIDEGLPGMQENADRYLSLNDSLRRLGSPYIEEAKRRVKMLDPVVCLYSLFRYLVKLEAKGRETLEWYASTYFPRFLRGVDIKPERASEWTYENLKKHFNRLGGMKAATRVAMLILSTDSRLLPFRPTPQFKNGMSPALDESLLNFQGRLYRYLPSSEPRK